VKVIQTDFICRPDSSIYLGKDFQCVFVRFINTVQGTPNFVFFVCFLHHICFLYFSFKSFGYDYMPFVYAFHEFLSPESSHTQEKKVQSISLLEYLCLSYHGAETMLRSFDQGS